MSSERPVRRDVWVGRGDEIAEDGHTAGLVRVLEQHDVTDELLVEASSDGSGGIFDALDEAVLQQGAGSGKQRQVSDGRQASEMDLRAAAHLGADSRTTACGTGGVVMTLLADGKTFML